MLRIPISLVLGDNTNDEGHGNSWIVVNYILQANLIGGLGGDEDPLPPDGANPHPIQAQPFGGIWEDQVFEENNNEQHQANNADNENDPMIPTPPQIESP